MNEDDTEPKSSREEWDSPITFTAKSSRKCYLLLYNYAKQYSLLIQSILSKLFLCGHYRMLIWLDVNCCALNIACNILNCSFRY